MNYSTVTITGIMFIILLSIAGGYILIFNIETPQQETEEDGGATFPTGDARPALPAVPLPPTSLPPVSEVVCAQVYVPVCGVDGKTYSNRCVAEEQNGIPVDYEGECAEKSAFPPPLPQPPPVTIPAVNTTKMPLELPDGFRISLFTPHSLGPIRFMDFSPDGILFVTKPSDSGLYQGGPGGVVYALPDKNKDGTADEVITAISGLNNRPHGIAFHDGYLYIAEESNVVRYKYKGNGEIEGGAEIIVGGLPVDGGHVSRTIGFGPSGKMYVSIGSSCNVCDERDPRRAAIVEYNPDGSGERIYANGIRNAVGMVFHPATGEIWATENGRDELGDDVPPDEINIIRDGWHYGWPYCYGKNSIDPYGNNSSLCSGRNPSIHDMQAHSAPLGLRFIQSAQFPEAWQGDLLVAYHGSWNRSTPTGYKVVLLEVSGNSVVGEEDFITGWLRPDESVLGRPVDLIFDSQGALYISDDKAGVIYQVNSLLE